MLIYGAHSFPIQYAAHAIKLYLKQMLQWWFCRGRSLSYINPPACYVSATPAHFYGTTPGGVNPVDDLRHAGIKNHFCRSTYLCGTCQQCVLRRLRFIGLRLV